MELRTCLCLFPKTLVKAHSCPSACLLGGEENGSGINTWTIRAGWGLLFTPDSSICLNLRSPGVGESSHRGFVCSGCLSPGALEFPGA